MSSPRTPSAVLSYRHFESLKSLMRCSEENLRVLTAALRSKYGRPCKNMAKAKAADKGLSVDIARARKCPQTAVSVVPLPVLDMTLSPHPVTTALPTSSTLRRRMRIQRRGCAPMVSSVQLSPLSPFTIGSNQPSALSFTPACQRPSLPRLEIPSFSAMTVSKFSAISGDDPSPMDISSAFDGDIYSPSPATPLLESTDLPYIFIENWDDLSSSTRSSVSSGPKTPKDCNVAEPVVVCIRKRKTPDDIEETDSIESYKNVKSRWSLSPDACEDIPCRREPVHTL